MEWYKSRGREEGRRKKEKERTRDFGEVFAPDSHDFDFVERGS